VLSVVIEKNDFNQDKPAITCYSCPYFIEYRILKEFIMLAFLTGQADASNMVGTSGRLRQ